MEIMMPAAPPSISHRAHDRRRPPTDSGRPGRHPRQSELRHPWADVQHPATADGERRFVEQLQDIASCDGPGVDTAFNRTEVTALVNALRGGLDAIDLLRRAPGLVPGRLVAAYDHVDQERIASTEAWAAIVADPAPQVVVEQAGLAARLLPVVVVELLDAARRGDHQLERRVAAAQREIDRVGAIARRLEASMDDTAALAMDAADIGRLLFDVEGPGLWSHNFFLPPRVGTLIPVRLAALLGEQAAAAA